MTLANNHKYNNEREIILLGFLNVDNVYGENWVSKKEEIKKDVEYKVVKLNQAFKYPSIFQENFEFLSSDDYNYVKNNYIYSAILIYNPHLNDITTNSNNNHDKQNSIFGNKKCNSNCRVTINECLNDSKRLNSEIKNQENIKENNELKEQEGNYNSEKKKEGIGVLVVTCKKMDKPKMKHILIKMIKKEIKVESTVLKYNGISNIANSANSENSENNASSENNAHTNKYADRAYISPSINIDKPFDVRRNNFFNMTAYIYGSSAILENTNLIQREYGDDEWANKLRKTKKERKEINKTNNDSNIEMFKDNKIIKTFTSLFKK
ncbi:conserved Plasmodium protein, unknown function [Plasmodium yoelii]|uniref:Uncharacterized protein n=2 Tax=Plasmodium yoelii TaxID=5861 RepID=A0AAE9WNX8_PLAYO|nr:conserved Plasmodium protein, unknown function [Plasmodium yoelii]WBY56045.1 hypothetical protein Py17XNL_000600724 [Plasmodium yoelii yoelii]CDU17027.1 conserved Plasmodium protein, unknown function [Plasmodium yoelii]VTZ75428.1 conserved Plasmodium protein, unknown function [Plasmodium yoelii]|eukprot:XP_724625.2 conserved Plasmodium protein, unknown function [Plasmodium yoelii]